MTPRFGLYKGKLCVVTSEYKGMCSLVSVSMTDSRYHYVKEKRVALSDVSDVSDLSLYKQAVVRMLTNTMNRAKQFSYVK